MHGCCAHESAAGRQAAPGKRNRRRLRAALEWAAPVATLALIPKCPLCVAGYVLVLTGAGVSLSTAAAIRWALIAASLLALAALVVRAARHHTPRRA
jgi:hypothetical protein